MHGAPAAPAAAVESLYYSPSPARSRVCMEYHAVHAMVQKANLRDISCTGSQQRTFAHLIYLGHCGHFPLHQSMGSTSATGACVLRPWPPVPPVPPLAAASAADFTLNNRVNGCRFSGHRPPHPRRFLTGSMHIRLAAASSENPLDTRSVNSSGAMRFGRVADGVVATGVNEGAGERGEDMHNCESWFRNVCCSCGGRQWSAVAGRAT